MAKTVGDLLIKLEAKGLESVTALKSALRTLGQASSTSDKKPGKFEKSEFTAIFKRVKMSEIQGVSEEQGVSLLKKVLVGWEGINDEDGDPIEFSESELDDFADDVDWLKAVLSAYTATYGEAQVGN